MFWWHIKQRQIYGLITVALEFRESFLFIAIVHSKAHEKFEASVVQQKQQGRCGEKLRL